MTLPTLTIKIAANGSLSAASGTQVFDANYDNSGTISVQTASLEITGNVFSTTSTAGSLVIGSSGSLQLDAGVDKNAIMFVDATGVLTIEQLSGITGAVTIEDLTPGDKVLIPGLPANFIENYNTATGVLSLFSGPTLLGTLTFGGVSIPALSTIQNAVVPCFAAGTRIATMRGEVAAEELQLGDKVVLAGGDTSPVVWLGHRRVDCRRHRKPQEVWPVRIQAGAFGAAMPHCDLRLSPDHAVFIRGDGAAPGDGGGAAPGDGGAAAPGVLIPIRYLINDATIVQEPVESVTYWHVELARHAVIQAEGLPCESYLDTGNRGAFANGGAEMQMHADFARKVWRDSSCAPLVLEGAELEAARSYLLKRAAMLGYATTKDAALRLVVDGRELMPWITGAVHRFRLPPAVRHVRLCSRSAVPAHVRDDSNDCRCLGVAVAGIALDGEPIALTDPRLGSGWHDVEPGWRWTDGNAVLEVAGARKLEIEIAITGRYWLPRARSVAEPRVAPTIRRLRAR